MTFQYGNAVRVLFNVCCDAGMYVHSMKNGGQCSLWMMIIMNLTLSQWGSCSEAVATVSVSVLLSVQPHVNVFPWLIYQLLMLSKKLDMKQHQWFSVDFSFSLGISEEEKKETKEKRIHWFQSCPLSVLSDLLTSCLVNLCHQYSPPN